MNLMLEDIRKILQVKKTLEKAIFVTGFLYNHHGALNMMRKFTKKRKLMKHGVTRFITEYKLMFDGDII